MKSTDKLLASLLMSVFRHRNYKNNLTTCRAEALDSGHLPLPRQEEGGKANLASACTKLPTHPALPTSLPAGAIFCLNEGERKKAEYFPRPSKLRHSFKEKRWTHGSLHSMLHTPERLDGEPS